ncbi:MAG: pyridoxamine 5'-phosphate oxidase family protein [Chitinophagales bacterium]|nr:pyridoxamine 5'-phosphate oxidase family protein [Chitinophagales bacterium]
MTTNKTKVKRIPRRGHYDPETIYAILDKEFVCNIGFIHEGYPVVIPTLYGRDGNHLYIHGSIASRMMKNLSEGIDLCLTVSRFNGLVLARSSFHHSMNYESVVLFGKAVEVTDREEKIHGFKMVSDHIIDGRWEEVRPIQDNELKATMLLKIPIEEASAKIRAEGVKDDKEDYELDIWAGIIPCKTSWESPIPDELMREGIAVPPSVGQFLQKKNGEEG